MARKSKVVKEESTIVDNEEHNVQIQPVSGVYNDSAFTSNKEVEIFSHCASISIPESSHESYEILTSDGLSSYNKECNDLNYTISCLLEGTMDEITRCNEYIYAKADADKKFTTYIEELYTYRYLLHQLKFNSKYPYVPISEFPIRPERVEDY